MIFFETETQAEDAEAPAVSGDLSIGYNIYDVTESDRRISEYQTFEQGGADGPSIGLSMRSRGDDYGIDLHGLFNGDKNDQGYYLNGDINRIFIERYKYNRFNHLLGHDPLTNLSAKSEVPTVSHEDFDTGRDYAISYTDQESKTTVNLPFLPGAQVGFDYRQQLRKGHKQALTMSKCGACHVSSHTQNIDEETQDFKARFSMKFGWLTVMYNFLRRNFSEKAPSPVNTYDDAVHPETGLDVFDDRLQYDGTSIKYSRVPSSEKNTHLFKGSANLPMATSFYGSFLRSDIENKETGFSIDQEVVAARITNQMIPALKLSLHFKYLSIDNDNTNVDVNEPVSANGPNAGYTWANPNPALTYNYFDPDFTRLSTMSRDITTFGFDARYHIWKKTYLKIDYEYQSTDREDYKADNNQKETEEHKIGLELRTRLNKKLNTRVKYAHRDIDHPFKNLKAACSQVDLAAVYGDPWTGIQYWELYENRIASLTNQPTAIDEVTLDAHWSIRPNLICSADLVLIDKENDDIEFSHWEQITYRPSVTLAYAPGGHFSFNLSYMFEKIDTDSVLYNIGVYDG